MSFFCSSRVGELFGVVPATGFGWDTCEAGKGSQYVIQGIMLRNSYHMLGEAREALDATRAEGHKRAM